MILRFGSLYQKGALACQRGKQTAPRSECSCKIYISPLQALHPPPDLDQLAAHHGGKVRDQPKSNLPGH